MAKVNVKTVELVGTEMCVDDLSGQNVAVKNLGSAAIWASAFPNVAAGADNVVEIPAGSGEVVLDAHGTVYLLGTGKVQCTGTPYAAPNFKLPSSSSGGGGGETGEKGAYCGITEFVGSTEGVMSATVEYSADFPARLAEILAEETGWELQADGVTVLKGGVGFKFTSTHVYLANDLGSPYDYNFQYINGSASNGITIDVCKSSGGAVAFGCRGVNSDGTELEMSMQFVLAQNANGDDLAMAEFQSSQLYLLAKGKSSGDVLTLRRMDKNTTKRSVSLTLLPDDTDGCLLKDVFFLLMYPSITLPGDSVFGIGGKRFRLLKSRGYTDNPPLLAIPI